jgi:4'-phosphopantetheinyl transferase EntD
VARAVPKRVLEFRAGRLLARAALARLALPPAPVLSRGRRPVWPAGVVGAISHADGCCGVAVARRGRIAGLGLDIEVAGAVTDRVLQRIASEDERADLAGLPASAPWATVLFGAKEAFYKSLAPLHEGFVGFHDVRVRMLPDEQCFLVEAVAAPVERILRGHEVRGRFALHGRWALAGVTLLAGELSPGTSSS